MKINSIAATNFKSRIKVIDTFNGRPEDSLSAKEIIIFKKAIKKLENNGNNDTVKIFFEVDNNEDKIGIKVEQDTKNKRLEGKETISRFYKTLNEYDILNAYNSAHKAIEWQMQYAPVSTFDKYI